VTYSQTFPRWYPDCYVVVGLGWSKDPENSAGCSVAAGRACRAGQVEGDNPDEKAYPGPSWGLGREDDNLAPYKNLMLRKPQICLGED
jgi:hypothetical protein